MRKANAVRMLAPTWCAINTIDQFGAAPGRGRPGTYQFGAAYAEVSTIEAARMLLAGVIDEGLAAAPSTVIRFGGLLGPASTTLEGALAHALARPDSLPPICSGLEIHTDSEVYALLTTLTADGAKTAVFGDLPSEETVDRTIVISGAALFAIASELAGRSAGDLDDLLKGMK
ncbi:hypothetical protein [Bradyrhizobium sp. McL0616]|uniref:hypothetical protein n=1 Tax=Bradyrhizobium sp. McL0616 TaxID=3415674 RepID=UPI003CEC95E1